MSVPNGTFTRTNSFGQEGPKNYPQFFMQSVQDLPATEAQGRPIYREEEWVKIIMPGNPWTQPVNRVTDEHRQMWPKEYAAFRAGQEISPDGTPLEQWPLLNRSQVLELKALGMLTVEHVAGLSDTDVQRFQFGNKMRELAKAYLDDAKAGQLVAKYAADNERKDAEIAALRRQVEEMGQRMESQFSELQTQRNAPHPIATTIPGMHDPAEIAKQARPAAAPVASSLDNIAAPKRRGKAA